MEDSAYNLQTSTLKTKDLEYSEPLRKCSGQERTNDVTAPNCSDNLASKSTRCGRRRHDLGPSAIAHLRNEPRLNWSQIARSVVLANCDLGVACCAFYVDSRPVSSSQRCLQPFWLRFATVPHFRLRSSLFATSSALHRSVQAAEADRR